MSAVSRIGDKLSHDLEAKNVWAEIRKTIAEIISNIGTDLAEEGLSKIPYPPAKAAALALKIKGYFDELNSIKQAIKGEDGIITSASENVIVNGLGTARCFSDTANCNKDGIKIILKTNSKVFVNGEPAVRAGDSVECGSVVAEGSKNVFFGDLS